MSFGSSLFRVAAVSLALLAAACDGGSSGGKKNVILITLDTTRADYLSCYGYRKETTPSLDALAADGTRFDMAVSTAGVTPVSHASILTGLNNQEHGLRVLSAKGGYRLPEHVPTLASVLSKEGYRTIAVHSAFPVSRRFGFQRSFDVFEDLNTEMKEDAKAGKDRWDVANFQRRSDATTDVVQKHVDKEPFFLWIHYWDPHDFEKSTLPPKEFQPTDAELYDANGDPVRPSPMYAAEIRYMDSQLGRLFDWLREKDLWDDTLVIVTADHGQGLGEHDWAAHRLLYQEQIHVPLIARIPGAKQAPVVRDLVRTIDIFPTVLDYVGVAPPSPVTGRSLRALMEGAKDEPRIAYGDQINGYDTNAGMTDKQTLDHFLYMAFDWPWKLIYRPMTPDQSLLYDVQADPDEAINHWATNVEVRTRLLKELARTHPWVHGEFEPLADVDGAGASEALDQLGYTAGQTVDPLWSWTCPEHMEQKLDAPNERCPLCKSPPIIIKRD